MDVERLYLVDCTVTSIYKKYISTVNVNSVDDIAAAASDDADDDDKHRRFANCLKLIRKISANLL